MARRKRQSLVEGTGGPEVSIWTRAGVTPCSPEQWKLALPLLLTPITSSKLLAAVGCNWSELEMRAVAEVGKEKWGELQRRWYEAKAARIVDKLANVAAQDEPAARKVTTGPDGALITETTEYRTDSSTANAALAKLLPDVYGDKSDAPAVGQAIQVNITIDGKSPDLSILGNFSDLGRKTMGEDAP